jgi:hypothetical protein
MEECHQLCCVLYSLLFHGVHPSDSDSIIILLYGVHPSDFRRNLSYIFVDVWICDMVSFVYTECSNYLYRSFVQLLV